MRVGLLGEPMPTNLQQMSFLVAAEDPLAELQPMHVPEGSVQALSRLLVATKALLSRISRLAADSRRLHHSREALDKSDVSDRAKATASQRPWRKIR